MVGEFIVVGLGLDEHNRVATRKESIVYPLVGFRTWEIGTDIRL